MKFVHIAILLVPSICFSQDIDLLTRISNLQSQSDSFYNDGLFASQRFKGKGRQLKEDNTIFFTALITYTLQSIKDSFPDSSRILIDSIGSKSKRNYFRYQNRNSDITYNFWQTRPDSPFPNSKILSSWKKMRLPDDLDDTAIIYLTRNDTDSLNLALRQKMTKHANRNKVKSTFKRYRDYQAYCTWFGVKQKQDLDICVMSNALVFVFQKRLPLTLTDHETLSLVKKIVTNNDHMEYPHIVSPHYQNSTIILYHLARLIAVADTPILDVIREPIVADIKKQLQVSDNEMEKIVLASSLARLGYPIAATVSPEDAEKDFEGFHWFRANFFSGSGMFVKKLIGQSGFLQYNYQCEAYYLALLLEFQVLSKSPFLNSGSGHHGINESPNHFATDRTDYHR